MFDFLIPMLFGWPAIILSLGFALAGIVFKRPALSLVSTVIFLAPAWYIGHYFAFSIMLPLFLPGSAYAISKNKIGIAFLLIVPVLIVIGRLGLLVLTQ